MSRITGSDALKMVEAYAAVYPSVEQIELTEEQVWEEVENWVNSLLEEGYDLSEYTWEEMYEAYIEENTGQRIGAGIRDVIGSNWRGLTGRQTSSTNPLSRATNVVGRAVSAPVRAGINYAGAVTQGYAGQKTTSKNPISRAANAVTRNISGAVKGLVTGDPGNPKKPSYTQSSERQEPPVPDRLKNAAPTPTAPRPTATAPAAPRPTATAPTGGKGKVAPAKPAAAQTGDKAADMATWAKANPKLAAAAAERARTRGTSATTNPQMDGLKSRLPAPAATPTPSPARNGFGVSAAPIAAKASVSTATAPEVKATNTIAAAPKLAPVSPRQARLNMEMEYDAYDVVLEYLLSQGHAETVEEAHYVMLEMDAETIGSIVEGVMPELIDPTAHNKSQRFATQQGKIRALQSGAATSGEKSAAQSKLKGPQLPGV